MCLLPDSWKRETRPHKTSTFRGMVTITKLGAVFQFKNEPGEVTITLTYDIGAGPQTVRLTVDIVEVKVELAIDPDNMKKTLPAFYSSGKSYDRGNFTTTDDAAKAKATMNGKTIATPLKQLGTNAVLDYSETNPGPGVSAGVDWRAKVTLIGTGPNHDKGVDKIVVSFAQRRKSQNWRSLFPRRHTKWYLTLPFQKV